MNDEEVASKVADKIVPKKITPESTRQRNLNPSLNSDIELKSSILTPQTGRGKIGNKLIEEYQDEWDNFSGVTSDTRISNLDPKLHEYKFVQWGMQCHLMCGQLGCYGAMAIAQGLVLAKTEPSLAKNMAFLKNIQTVRQESQHIQVEENNKSRGLFGQIKDKVTGGN